MVLVEELILFSIPALNVILYIAPVKLQDANVCTLPDFAVIQNQKLLGKENQSSKRILYLRMK